MQWAVNAYLLSLAAFFAYGGRLADTVGRRKMVTAGVIVFAVASLLCGLTPKGAAAQTWIVIFRAVQGAGGAIMYPAALGIVVQTFALRERGKALALFFGIAGGLTAVGPILGGYLTEWTWRAIFWVNIPVARHRAGPDRRLQPGHRAPACADGLPRPGADRRRCGAERLRLPAGQIWRWSNPGIGLCIGPAWSSSRLLPRGAAYPLPADRDADLRNRAFFVENLVLGISMLVFVPLFFFASEYAQISLGKSASGAGLYLLYFFLGFVIASQIGGRMLDRGGARRPVIWAARCRRSASTSGGKGHRLDFGAQIWYIVLAGAGVGMMLAPASTDAVNRASRLSYGQATGITQTVRNYSASLGLAVLGTISVARLSHTCAPRCWRSGVPDGQATPRRPDRAVPPGPGPARAAIPHSSGWTSRTPPAPSST